MTMNSIAKISNFLKYINILWLSVLGKDHFLFLIYRDECLQYSPYASSTCSGLL